MTGSEDHILGRFPRHPLPLAEPGRYTASVRGVVKSVVSLADG